VDYVKELVAQ